MVYTDRYGLLVGQRDKRAGDYFSWNKRYGTKVDSQIVIAGACPGCSIAQSLSNALIVAGQRITTMHYEVRPVVSSYSGISKRYSRYVVVNVRNNNAPVTLPMAHGTANNTAKRMNKAARPHVPTPPVTRRH